MWAWDWKRAGRSQGIAIAGEDGNCLGQGRDFRGKVIVSSPEVKKPVAALWVGRLRWSTCGAGWTARVTLPAPIDHFPMIIARTEEGHSATK
jgi:hypothetical protein